MGFKRIETLGKKNTKTTNNPTILEQIILTLGVEKKTIKSVKNLFPLKSDNYKMISLKLLASNTESHLAL